MSYKLFTLGLFLFALVFSASGQKIIVDSTSSNKYLIKPDGKKVEQPVQVNEETTFSDRALSIGKGILNRLKARLNLEEAADSFKEKKDKILGKEEETDTKKEEDG